MLPMLMIAKRYFLWLCVLGCVFMLAGCADGKFEISDAWVAEAPPNASAQAGYVTLRNNTAKPMSLISVTSDSFGNIQIHRSEHDEVTGLMRMKHEKQADIPPHTTLQFKPGGYHLMLMKPKLALKEGDQVVMDLRFADGTNFSIIFAVRREKFNLQG